MISTGCGDKKNLQPVTTKLDQSGLGRVQGEAKSAESCGQLVLQVRRLLLILKPQHDIIGTARDDDIA
jgi:hypothetical protein